MRINPLPRLLALVLAVTTTALHAQVPQIINYQGLVAVGNPPVNFDGTGSFKFALVQGTGPTLLWKNDGSGGNTEPAAAVTLTVTKGLYSVLLGDTTLTNMTAIPATVFANPDVRLRVWFNDGTNGSQLISPDQRLAAVGYAITAGSVPAGAISSAQLADGAVTSAKLGSDIGVWSVTGGNVYRNTGNVGLGKTDPAYKLDVNGVVNVTAVRFPDGSILRSAAGIGDPPLGTVNYNAAGTYSWVAPANATSIIVDLLGGGGGGGGGGPANDASTVTHTIGAYTGTCALGGTGGGGGGGGNRQRSVYYVTPGTTYTVIVGAGGAGGPLNQAGAAGGITSFKLAAATIASANGGSGGAAGATLPQGIAYDIAPIPGGAGGAGGGTGTLAPGGTSIVGGNGKTGIGGAFAHMNRDMALANQLLMMGTHRFLCGPYANEYNAAAAGTANGGAGGQGASRQSSPANSASISDDPGTAGAAGSAGSLQIVIY